MNKQTKNKVIEIKKALRGKRPVNEFEVITLCRVLNFIQRKFQLKEFSAHLQLICASWRYGFDDLARQYDETIALIHYLVFITLPKTNGTEKPTEKTTPVCAKGVDKTL